MPLCSDQLEGELTEPQGGHFKGELCPSGRLIVSRETKEVGGQTPFPEELGQLS